MPSISSSRSHMLVCFTLASVAALACMQGKRTSPPLGSPLPAPTGYVNDFAGVIDTATKQRVEEILTDLKRRADIEVAVMTIKTTGGQDIFDYSLRVARGWGIGSPEGEKNGLLLLIVVDDRNYFIQVSRHLEGDLPDGLVGEVGRRMRAPFRENRYGEGLMSAVQTLVATISERRGFSVEGVDQRYASRPGGRACTHKATPQHI